MRRIGASPRYPLVPLDRGDRSPSIDALEDILIGAAFQILEAVVRVKNGPSASSSLLRDAGRGAGYEADRIYTLGEFYNVMAAYASARRTTFEDCLRWCGRESVPILATRYPECFASRRSTRDFVVSLGPVLESAFARMYPNGPRPLECTVTRDGLIQMSYYGRPRLCSLIDGVIDGAALYYGDSVDASHAECVRRGHSRCLWIMTCLTKH